MFSKDIDILDSQFFFICFVRSFLERHLRMPLCIHYVVEDHCLFYPLELTWAVSELSFCSSGDWAFSICPRMPGMERAESTDIPTRDFTTFRTNYAITAKLFVFTKILFTLSLSSGSWGGQRDQSCIGSDHSSQYPPR